MGFYCYFELPVQHLNTIIDHYGGMSMIIPKNLEISGMTYSTQTFTHIGWAPFRVLALSVFVTMDDDFCVNALKSALRKHQTPVIFNTDQGAQYTGKAFTGALKDHGVQISMDGKVRCMDNIFIERLWRSVKYEKIFLEVFETVPELLSGLKEYFKFYNFERPHQSQVRNTPAETYWGSEVARKAV